MSQLAEMVQQKVGKFGKIKVTAPCEGEGKDEHHLELTNFLRV